MLRARFGVRVHMQDLQLARFDFNGEGQVVGLLGPSRVRLFHVRVRHMPHLQCYAPLYEWTRFEHAAPYMLVREEPCNGMLRWFN